MAVKNTSPVVPTIQKVSADKVPGGAKRGRERTPSMFDEYMVIDGEWVEATFSSDEELKKLNAELTKALKFANENAGPNGQVGVERRTGLNALYFLVGEKRVTKRSQNGTKDESENETTKS